ncbi:hypothetical protein [Bifidobacterium sp. SO1]|uniref:hypothetical protein n=1 Tax=Bifidobacterium sp. SO1 TaxID=2809029 RepID=UPI001BDD2B11|nr:hypothetical protein [Bifidobacterium sp. SO1]MBT1160281.1 hypothetical protein [Bifidobacterium sp. SO1]
MTVEDKKELAVAGEGAQKKNIKAIVIAAIVAVVVIVAAVVVGVTVFGGPSVETLKADCATASDDLRVAQNEYNGLVNGDAATASAYTKDDVNDAKTLDALNKELSAETPELASCNVDADSEYETAIENIKKNTTWYQDHTKTLQKAVDAVNASLKQ